MLSAIFAILFGVSLLPGRKPLCLRFAERISGGIMPEGAVQYCRRLTWIWFAILLALTAFNVSVALAIGRSGNGSWAQYLSFALPLAVVPLVFLVEGRIRRRRFSVAFHTSGSTGGPKTIVKTFENLAREVAFHRDTYAALFPSQVSGKPTFLCTIEPLHMYGTLWRVMLPEALGCEVDPEVIMTPESLVSKMKTAERVFLVTTPSFLDRFTSYASGYDVPQNCVEITTSGSLLAPDVAARTERVFGMAPREIFGSTETGGIASRRQSAEARAKGDVRWEVFSPVRISPASSGIDGISRLEVRSPFSLTPKYTMGDGVEIAPDGRSFRLLGRMDRLVKINEERVNLAEMEAKVKALGFDDCAITTLEGTHGTHLGCLIATSRPNPPSALEMRKLTLPIFPKGTIPKKFRFTRELPRNAQGKVLACEVRGTLESALVEPSVSDEQRTESEYSAKLVFQADAPYFDGHFEGTPILPGVAQVGLAIRYSRLIGSSGELKCAKKVKFTHIIQPGDEVDFTVVRKEPCEFSYTYKLKDAVCSSGVLQF